MDQHLQRKPRSVNEKFSAIAVWTSQQSGRASTFILTCILILAWAVSGPFFHFSDTWQLVVNTGTTIITFLMVFLIQNTQNRDMAALHLKLDELIRVNHEARNKLLNLEDLTEEELAHIKGNFRQLADDDQVDTLRDAQQDLAGAQEKIIVATEKLSAAVHGEDEPA